jgi:hypothetical protein
VVFLSAAARWHFAPGGGGANRKFFAWEMHVVDRAVKYVNNSLIGVETLTA